MMAGRNRENSVSVQELIAAEEELAELKREHGIEDHKKRGLISRLLDKLTDREEVTVNRKKYLLLNVFLGWAGGHRFYSKRYLLGTIYLLLCWTGLSVAMSIIDILVAIPKPVDEEGNMQI